MNVLMLTTEVGGRGGVQYAGRLLLRALGDCLGKSCRITLLTLSDRFDASAGFAEHVRVFAGNGSRWRTASTAVWQLRKSWDLVILGHINLAPLVLTRGSRLPPLLTVIYGLDGWQPVRGLWKRGLKRSRMVLFISQHSQAESQKINPWLGDLPSAICHLALLPQEKEPLPENPCDVEPVSQEKEFALIVGRMARNEAYKGHEELIRIWPQVERSRPGLQLAIIGEGDDRLRLEALVRHSGANVRFVGAVDDLSRDRYLQNCRCFCLPSRGEGFGLVYLEAMRAGKPVLAGNEDAGKEVVLDGITGRAVNPQNPDDLLQGILDVSGDKAEQWGGAGKERFDRHFCYEAFRDRLHEILNQVLPAKKNSGQ